MQKGVPKYPPFSFFLGLRRVLVGRAAMVIMVPADFIGELCGTSAPVCALLQPSNFPFQTTDLFNFSPTAGNGFAMGCGLGKNREFFLKWEKETTLHGKIEQKIVCWLIFFLCLASVCDASKRNCILEWFNSKFTFIFNSFPWLRAEKPQDGALGLSIEAGLESP